jgi:DNA polymerase alpha subunit B
MYPKNMEPPKIDLSLKALIEQRIFYPLFPGNPETPIEYEQIEKLYINEMPDLLITSSDLIQFVKTIDGVLCVNPGAIIKNDTAGTFCNLTIEPFDYRSYVSDFHSNNT